MWRIVIHTTVTIVISGELMKRQVFIRLPVKYRVPAQERLVKPLKVTHAHKHTHKVNV